MYWIHGSGEELRLSVQCLCHCTVNICSIKEISVKRKSRGLRKDVLNTRVGFGLIANICF